MQLPETGPTDAPRLPPVPRPRSLLGAGCGALPDLALAVWLGLLLARSARDPGTAMAQLDDWRWWFAYELFSLFATFLVVTFCPGLGAVFPRDAAGRTFRGKDHWVALGIALAMYAGLLAKASFDIRGNLSLLGCFLAVLAVRYAALSIRPHPSALDHFIEHVLQALATMPAAFAAGFLVSRLLGHLNLPPEAPWTELPGRATILRDWLFLASGLAYYLAMATLTFVLARWPQFTLAGLDAGAAARQHVDLRRTSGPS